MSSVETTDAAAGGSSAGPSDESDQVSACKVVASRDVRVTDEIADMLGWVIDTEADIPLFYRDMDVEAFLTKKYGSADTPEGRKARRQFFERSAKISAELAAKSAAQQHPAPGRPTYVTKWDKREETRLMQIIEEETGWAVRMPVPFARNKDEEEEE